MARWFIGIVWGLSPVDPGSIHAQTGGFNRVITLSRLCTYTYAPAYQTIHPSGVGKLLPGICRGNSASRSVSGSEVCV